MESRVVQESDEIRAAVLDIVRTNTDRESLMRLIFQPLRQLCIFTEYDTLLTVTGKEDGIIEVKVECPSIAAHTIVCFEIIDFF